MNLLRYIALAIIVSCVSPSVALAQATDELTTPKEGSRLAVAKKISINPGFSRQDSAYSDTMNISLNSPLPGRDVASLEPTDLTQNQTSLNEIPEPGSTNQVYLDDLSRSIKRCWFPTLPTESKDCEVGLRLNADGELISLRVKRTSGDLNFDNSVLKAIEVSSPFRPLPSGSVSLNLDLDFKLDPNGKVESKDAEPPSLRKAGVLLEPVGIEKIKDSESLKNLAALCDLVNRINPKR